MAFTPTKRIHPCKFEAIGGYEAIEKACIKRHGLKKYICAELKITRQTFDSWLKLDPKIKEIFQESQDDTDDFVTGKMMELIDGLQDKPDIKAIDIYYKLRNRYVSRVENQNINVNFDIGRDMENMSVDDIRNEINKLSQ